MSVKAGDFHIEKLKGNSNYHTWKFAINNMLELNDLENCIETNATGVVIETDEKKLKKAKNLLSLSVDTSFFVHIQNANSAAEIWKTFQRLYEDKGLSRKIGLLRNLISSRLEDQGGMQEYVDQIINTSNKLSGVGFPISDEWIGAILLAGLTDDYKPFIMGIESSGVEMTGDAIISKLIDNRIDSKEGAFFSKNTKKKNFKKNLKCDFCHGKSHTEATCYKKHGKPNTGKSKVGKQNADKEAAFMVKNIACKSNAEQMKNEVKCDEEKFFEIASIASTSNSNDDHGEYKNEEKIAATALLSFKKRYGWYLDSGASSHMTPYGKLLSDQIKSKSENVLTANNTQLKVNASGNAKLLLSGNTINVSGVLHVPDLSANLLSVYKICSRGNEILFNADGCTIYSEQRKIVAFCKAENGMYKVTTDNEKCYLANSKPENAMLWHRRLGHLNLQSMKKMRNAVEGIKFEDDVQSIENCEICSMGKQCRQSFPRSTNETTKILELVHSDMVGPMETLSIGKARYILTFIDDFSKRAFVYFLKSKSEAFETFLEFKNYVENQAECKIKIVRTDNGTEYVNNRFESLFKSAGIKHQLTAPYTPQQNGVAERFNRTVIEKAKCLLFDAKLSKTYWAEAVNMATYLINRTINSSDAIPEEKWTGRKVNLSYIKLFGSPVMVHIPKEKRKKLDPKSEKLIFVGYDSKSKAYRCINTTNRKLTISRDVKFHETSTSNELVVPLFDETDEVRDDQQVSQEETENLTLVSDDEREASNESGVSEHSSDPAFEPDESIGEIEQTDRNTRSMRFWNFAKIASELPINEFALKCDEKNPSDDPICVKDLKNRGDFDEWLHAMQDEISSLKENNTWSLIETPPNAKIVKTKWVFKTKRDTNGDIVRYKARLVAKGYTQREGIDYTETYAPVVRYASIRILMAIAIHRKLRIHQMDAVTAFLQGDIEETIYLEQPEGFHDGTNRVCKLNRAMYGLKQAGRQWNKKLDRALHEFGLKNCKMDPCIYYSADLKLIIAIYVDDFLIFYEKAEKLQEIMTLLSHTFKMKDMGTAKGCIGIRITQKDDCIELDQSVYIEEILKRFGMTESKPSGTPSDTNCKLSLNMETEEADETELKNIPYQEAVGSLLYLAQGTRPDIAFAVNNVSRFNSNYTMAHWKSVKRILRYIRGTTNYKLTFSFEKTGEIIGYSDADWASDIDKRRSCTGYVFKLSNAAITWKSTRQSTVALSSTEAEYMAISSAIQEAIWLRQLCHELGFTMKNPTKMNCDNQSAILLAKSDGYRQRSKHIDIRYHHIRDKIKDKQIEIKFLCTNEMVADSLTKAVSQQKTLFCANAMGLMNPHQKK